MQGSILLVQELMDVDLHSALEADEERTLSWTRRLSGLSACAYHDAMCHVQCRTIWVTCAWLGIK